MYQELYLIKIRMIRSSVGFEKFSPIQLSPEQKVEQTNNIKILKERRAERRILG